MKGFQCYELFGGIALENHAFSFHFISNDVLIERHSNKAYYFFTLNGFCFTIKTIKTYDKTCQKPLLRKFLFNAYINKNWLYVPFLNNKT